MDKSTKKILGTIVILLATLILLIPFWYVLILSLKEFSPMRGLFGSPWVGFKNFSAFINSPYFTKILSNTFVISILGTIIGAVYVFISSLAIGSGKNSVKKGILALIFALPAIIPINLFAGILPREILMTPSFLLRLAVSVIDGLRVAGLLVICAFFIKDDVLKNSLKCMLLFVAIRFIFIMTPDAMVINRIYNPLTYEILDVFSTYTYRTGLINANYSMAASVHIIKTLLQFIPCVIACLILVLITKNKAEKTVVLENSNFQPAVIGAVVPAIILIATIITGGSLLPADVNKMVIMGYVNEILIALVSGILVTVISLGLAIAARNSGAIGLIAIALLCLTGNCMSGKYLLIHTIGLTNTFLGVVLNNLSMISVLALILTFATYNNRGLINNVSAFTFGFGMMFSWFWGDSISPMTILRDRAVYPLSLVLREITISAGEITSGFLTTLPYIIIPIAVAVAGIAVGVLIKKD